MQEATARLVRCLEASGDEFSAFDERWRYLYLNEGARRAINSALGTTLSMEDLAAKTVWDLFPEFAGTDLHTGLERVRADGGALRFEAFSEPDSRWTEVRAFPWDGGVAAYTRDITERRLARQQLRYQAITLDSVEDGIIFTDADDFRVTAWNAGAERLYGFSAEEVLGRPAREVASYPGDEARLKLEAELRTAGRTRIEFTAVRKDGSPVEVELIALAVTDERGGVAGYLGIHRDNTERTRATARLATAAREQAVLADLSLRALGGDGLQPLLNEAITVVADVLQVEFGSIAGLEPEGGQLRWRAAFGWSAAELASAPPSAAGSGSLAGYAVLTGGPVVSEDVAADGRFSISAMPAARAPASAAAVVIPGPGRPFGALAVLSRKPRAFRPDEVAFLQAMANVIAGAVERAGVDERVETARDAERHRIARELHDQCLRELTDALGIATLARSASPGQRDEHHWATLTTALQRLDQQLRSAIYDLRLDIDDHPFAALLADLVDLQNELGGQLEVSLHGQRSLPAGSLGDRGTEVLRIVREAITNARRHSGAARVRVDSGASTHGLLKVAVTDDGDWPDRDARHSSRRGTGIVGMLERAEQLGAALSIESAPGGGTRVSLELILSDPRSDR